MLLDNSDILSVDVGMSELHFFIFVSDYIDFNPLAQGLYNDNNYWATLNSNAAYSQTLKNTVTEFSTVITNFSEGIETVSDAQNVICDFYAEKVGLFSGEELQQFGTFIDIANSSLQYWSPNNLGGENGIVKYSLLCDSNDFTNSTELRGWFSDIVSSSKLANLVLSDANGGIAAATLSVVNSAGAAKLPLCGGIPCAGVAGVLGAGFTSAGYLFTQL